MMPMSMLELVMDVLMMTMSMLETVLVLDVHLFLPFFVKPPLATMHNHHSPQRIRGE